MHNHDNAGESPCCYSIYSLTHNHRYIAGRCHLSGCGHPWQARRSVCVVSNVHQRSPVVKTSAVDSRVHPGDIMAQSTEVRWSSARQGFVGFRSVYHMPCRHPYLVNLTYIAPKPGITLTWTAIPRPNSSERPRKEVKRH